jgi:hypothetical protein
MASPMARLQQKTQAAVTTGLAGSTRHSLRDGFNGFLRTLPGDRAFLPPSSARSSRKLSLSVGRPGPYDFAVRVCHVLLACHPRPSHPRLTYRDDRAYVPLHRGGMGEKMLLICPTPQARTHAADWHDGQLVHGAHAGVTRRGSACQRNCRTFAVGGTKAKCRMRRADRPLAASVNARLPRARRRHHGTVVRTEALSCSRVKTAGRFAISLIRTAASAPRPNWECPLLAAARSG